MKRTFFFVIVFLPMHFILSQDIDLDVQNKQILISSGHPSASLKSNEMGFGELNLYDSKGIRSSLALNEKWNSGELRLFDASDLHYVARPNSYR